MNTIAFTDLPFIVQLIVAGVALLFAGLAVLPVLLTAGIKPNEIALKPKPTTARRITVLAWLVNR